MTMVLGQAFKRFLTQISPGEDLRNDLQAGHRGLCDALLSRPDAGVPIAAVFVQGSHRRSTAIRPPEDARPTIDLVVVTTLEPRRCPPEQALNQLRSLLQRRYAGRWIDDGRSLGVHAASLDLHLVVAATSDGSDALRSENTSEALSDAPPAPAEALAWRLDPLLIPNSEASRWCYGLLCARGISWGRPGLGTGHGAGQIKRRPGKIRDGTEGSGVTILHRV